MPHSFLFVCLRVVSNFFLSLSLSVFFFCFFSLFFLVPLSRGLGISLYDNHSCYFHLSSFFVFLSSTLHFMRTACIYCSNSVYFSICRAFIRLQSKIIAIDKSPSVLTKDVHYDIPVMSLYATTVHLCNIFACLVSF